MLLCRWARIRIGFRLRLGLWNWNCEGGMVSEYVYSGLSFEHR